MNDRLLITLLAVIALAALAGVIVLSFYGKPVDGSLIATMSGSAGALAALARAGTTPPAVTNNAVITPKDPQ